MKYSAVLCILILFACGCILNEARTKLLNEQKFLKDSANNISERIGGYMQKGVYDSAGVQKKYLGAVHAGLTGIQSSIDSPAKIK